MKNLIYIFALSMLVVSCKKKSNDPATQNSSNNSTSTPTTVAWSKPSTFFDSKVVRTFCSLGSNLYVGCDKGGFMSSDGGSNWNRITTNLATIVNTNNVLGYDSLIQYVYSDGISLYAIVNQTAQSAIMQPSPVKIYKTVDNGANWTFFSSVSDPSQAAATGIKSISFIGSKIFACSPKYIYVSTNAGTSWTMNYDAGTSGSLNFDVIYNGVNYFASNGSTIAKSTNGGVSFSTNSTPNSILATNIIANNTILYVADKAGNNGVFKSSDNGSTWTVCNTGIVSSFAAMQVRTLLASNSKEYAGITNRIFNSSNDGASWSQLGADLPNSSSTNTIYPNFIIRNSGYVYAMTSAGLFKIAD